jgi:Uma2 family endonuclease
MATQSQPRRRFTVDEYHKMGDAGVFTEDDRLELIDGEIIKMSPINIPHAVCVDLLTMLFASHLIGRGIVRVQNPIFIDDINEPQPDLALLKQRDYLHQHQHPGAGDILLVIEVADTTVRLDRHQKIPRYAHAGIPEAWIVNITRQEVEVYSDPIGAKYRSIQRVGHGGVIILKAMPDVTVAVDDFLGRPQ